MTKLRYWLLRGLILFSPLLLVACAGNPDPIPSLPSEPIIAHVAVPVPCEIAQVAPAADPAVQARKGDDVFTLAKIALASRQVLIGENAELRAANQTPCPGAD